MTDSYAERYLRGDEKIRPSTFDTKCYDLAKAFMEDGNEPELNQLAADIQKTIEDFLENREDHTREALFGKER